MARSVECKCGPNFTCGHCLRNAKPWHWTHSTAAERLVSMAARATEHFSEDELEEFAKLYQKETL